MNTFFALVLLPFLLLADDVPTGGVVSILWVFVNSPIGITLVTGAILWVGHKVFTAKPRWEETYDRFRPMFFQAVKYAEGAIDDKSENAAMRKADAAIKFVLKLQKKGSVSRKTAMDIRKAVDKAHGEFAAKIGTIEGGD